MVRWKKGKKQNSVYGVNIVFKKPRIFAPIVFIVTKYPYIYILFIYIFMFYILFLFYSYSLYFIVIKYP